MPFKGVKGWAWENYWLIGGLFSWLIVPPLAAWLIHAGHDTGENHSHLTPIYASSTYVFDTAEQGMRRFSGDESGYIYSRWGNPSMKEAEEKIGIHGVSVSTNKSSVPSSSSTSSILELAGFIVRHTPTRRDKGHHTVELPKPVTKEVADKFNKAFGRD